MKLYSKTEKGGENKYWVEYLLLNPMFLIYKYKKKQKVPKSVRFCFSLWKWYCPCRIKKMWRVAVGFTFWSISLFSSSLAAAYLLWSISDIGSRLKTELLITNVNKNVWTTNSFSTPWSINLYNTKNAHCQKMQNHMACFKTKISRLNAF